jgi:hypothetical protein
VSGLSRLESNVATGSSNWYSSDPSHHYLIDPAGYATHAAYSAALAKIAKINLESSQEASAINYQLQSDLWNIEADYLQAVKNALDSTMSLFTSGGKVGVGLVADIAGQAGNLITVLEYRDIGQSIETASEIVGKANTAYNSIDSAVKLSSNFENIAHVGTSVLDVHAFSNVGKMIKDIVSPTLELMVKKSVENALR